MIWNKSDQIARDKEIFRRSARSIVLGAGTLKKFGHALVELYMMCIGHAGRRPSQWSHYPQYDQFFPEDWQRRVHLLDLMLLRSL